jgi:cytochrome P450
MADVAVLSPAVPKPPHVPDSLVYDFDYFYDPAFVANPHDRALDIARNAPPVFWTPRQGGHWVLLSHAANFEASRDWDSFSSTAFSPEQRAKLASMLPKDMGHIPQTVPISVDPPEHGLYRTPIQGPFSPKAIMALERDIRALAVQLIEKIKDEGRCEFMSEVAEPMPVQVFLKMMGLPLDRQAEYRALVREHLASISADIAVSIGKMQKIAATMRETFLDRRENPKDDLITLLWNARIDGRPTTMDDMENYGVLLFIAGLDTVMNGMGFGVRHLATDLALQDRLRGEPDLIPMAVEELLRRYTFTIPVRRVAKDIKFEGVAMKEGERALMFLPGADLDPREFADPGKFDLDRENTVHIAFNSGPHRCLGSHLARVELKVLYQEMLTRLPQFRLDPDKPPKFHGGNVVGVDSLSLVWSA